jgi:hypothetical protein
MKSYNSKQESNSRIGLQNDKIYIKVPNLDMLSFLLKPTGACGNLLETIVGCKAKDNAIFFLCWLRFWLEFLVQYDLFFYFFNAIFVLATQAEV